MDQVSSSTPSTAPLLISNDTLLTTVPTATSSTVLNSMNQILPTENQHEKILSVSGKKKCSHCGDELGK